MKQKRFLGILLTLTMLVSLLPTFSITASAATETVSYIERSWDGSKVVSTTKTATATVLESNDSNVRLDSGWFVVKGDVTISGRLDVFRNQIVNLILCDGATLTVRGGIDVSEQREEDLTDNTKHWAYTDTLNIYAQTEGSGKIVAHSLDPTFAPIGARYRGDNFGPHGGILNIHGGNIIATLDFLISNSTAVIGGGSHGDGIDLTIYGGNISAVNVNADGFFGSSAHGGAAIGGGVSGNGGNVTIYGGNIKTVGGYASEDIGKGENGSHSGTLKNGSGDVVLHTITVDGATDGTAITDIGGVNYNCSDMRTFDTNKVYVYLPEDADPTSITAGGITYELTCKSDINYYTKHSYKNGTCIENSVCEVCGDENGPLDPDVHACSGESYRDEGKNDTHGVYIGCGYSYIGEEAHTYGSDFRCTKCDHKCTHSLNSQTGKCDHCGGVCAHQYVRRVIMEPECTAQGLAFYDCKICGYGYEAVLPATGHNYSYSLANYDSQHLGVCDVCGHRIQEAHSYVNNCRCFCGYIGKDSPVHAYESVVTPPTCTDGGYTTYTCTICEKVTVGDNVASLGHSGGEMTCTERAICDVCGEHYGEEPEGHSWAPDDDTCLTPVVCPDCGEVTTPARDEHEWDEYNTCVHCQTGKSFVFTFMDGEKEVCKADVIANSYYYFNVLEDKDGLTFLGWDSDGDGSADYAGLDMENSIHVGGDMTFNAVYGEIFLVRYFGIGYDSGEYELSAVYQFPENGDPISLEYDYAYWYKALGWATEPNGEKVYDYGEKVEVSHSLSLYTVARPFEATVDLAAEDAVWNDKDGNPITVIRGTITDPNIYLYDFPARPGYKFMGFVSDEYEYTYFDEDWETGEIYLCVYLNDDAAITAVWEECTEHSYVNGKCEHCGAADNCVFAITEYDKATKTAFISSPEVGTYIVIFSDYENEVLKNVEVATVTFTEQTKGTVLPASITENFNLDKDDKIMLWSDVTGLSPKCEALIIE